MEDDWEDEEPLDMELPNNPDKVEEETTSAVVEVKKETIVETKKEEIAEKKPIIEKKPIEKVVKEPSHVQEYSEKLNSFDIDRIEGILKEFIEYINFATEKTVNATEESDREQKKISSLKRDFDELINKADEVVIKHHKAKEDIDKVLGDFEDELKEMIHSIDTSFLSRDVLAKINEVSKSIPVSDLNLAASGIRKSLEGLTNILSDNKNNIEQNIKINDELKTQLAEGVEKVTSTVKVIQEANSKISLKENYFLATFITVASILFGVTIGYIYGISSSQKFISDYLIEMNKNVSTQMIENKSSKNAYSYMFKNDGNGDYIVLSKDGKFVQENNSNNILYYIKKKD